MGGVSLDALSLRALLPFNSSLASSVGGYGLNAVVPDGSTPGKFWVSTVAGNVSVPGASGASWGDLFAGLVANAGGDLGGIVKASIDTPTGNPAFQDGTGNWHVVQPAGNYQAAGNYQPAGNYQAAGNYLETADTGQQSVAGPVSFMQNPTGTTAPLGTSDKSFATTEFAARLNSGRNLNTTVITSSQTYTVPAGVYKIRVRLQAAGGAAGGSADNTSGGGSSCASSGGAGAYVEAIFPATPGQQIPISIGVGGVGVTGKAGGTGGASTFGPFGSFAALSCPGGLGGYAGTQTSSSAASSIPGCPGNGLPSGPNIVYAVAAAGGLPGIAVLGTAAAPPGSNSPMGAGGAGITVYNGGTSQPGGNAGGWGGGGGAHANQQAAQNAGGAGANGVGIIDEFSA
ncbi:MULTISPECIES: hypothetical protein [unclassified Asaia]|uniref:glycine-rich domain-containing protein n=1 Tax=unclassified Asaia TaxID=2685023 RepID=UPI000F8EE748|nr:hypothetical protein [Asaia sp. W19]